MLANIYVAKDRCDCSADGISSRVSRVYVSYPGNIIADSAATADCPIVDILPGHRPQLQPYRAVPRVQPERKNGPMFGGCFVYSSDSRFPGGKPIPLHDRFEDWS